MKIMDVGGIPTSLGEIVNYKFHLDIVKDGYDQIRLGFATGLWDGALHTESPDWPQRKILWEQYLLDIGQLFFSKPPYVLESNPTKWGGSIESFVQRFTITPQKVELAHLLCKGMPLNLGEKYIVITTKVRHIDRPVLFPLLEQFWPILKKLSNKYKIVVLGEKQVEMRKEYDKIRNEVFGIYNHIIANVPNDRLLDLTVPALGETVSSLAQIQQDCLIMKEAELTITFGVGGNFCLATSVSNMAIGFRADSIAFTDIIFHGREYPNAIITKDWHRFMQALRSYL
jgi:hypothetical protein